MSYREDITGDLGNVPDGWTVTIAPEEGMPCPYDDWDMFGTIWAEFRDSGIGDASASPEPQDAYHYDNSLTLETIPVYDRSSRSYLGDREIETWGDMRRELERLSPGIVALMIEYNDHRYYARFTTTDNDGAKWRPGTCGVIYATAETIRKEFPRRVLDHGSVGVLPEHCRPMKAEYYQRIPVTVREKAKEALRNTVETIDQWATGDVWWVCIDNEEGDTVDSCGGFYGRDYAEEQAQEMLDSAAAEYHAAKEEEAEEMAFASAY